jgi:murein DD-endopeptidase MepM/ murein hydrolase activator NlpD
MSGKKYIIAVGKAEGNRLFATAMTRSKLCLVLLTCLGFIIVLAYVTGNGFHTLQMIGKINSLERDNAFLNLTVTSCENRIQNLSLNLKDFQKKQKLLHKTVDLSMPEIAFGVGGPKFSSLPTFYEIPTIEKADLNLTRLEDEMELTKQALDELEKFFLLKEDRIAHYPSIRPVRSGWLSSTFGPRLDPFTGKPENHPGIDISIHPGSNIFAPATGTVKRINRKVIKNKGYGKYIIIDHGYGYETLFAHLSEIHVSPGQKIDRWDLIGLTGNSGKSTAPHLHYEVHHNKKAQNPINFILE